MYIMRIYIYILLGISEVIDEKYNLVDLYDI